MHPCSRTPCIKDGAEQGGSWGVGWRRRGRSRAPPARTPVSSPCPQGGVIPGLCLCRRRSGNRQPGLRARQPGLRRGGRARHRHLLCKSSRDPSRRRTLHHLCSHVHTHARACTNPRVLTPTPVHTHAHCSLRLVLTRRTLKAPVHTCTCTHTQAHRHTWVLTFQHSGPRAQPARSHSGVGEHPRPSPSSPGPPAQAS